jgi:hypothetical protein
LIAAENHLILVEAKAYGSWDMIQLESKLTRIKLIKGFYEEFLRNKNNKEPIYFNILLLSPCDLPSDKRDILNKKLGISKLDLPWIKLCLPLAPDQIREVGRCDREGHRRRDVSPSEISRWGIYELDKKRLPKNAEPSNLDACSNEAAALGRSIQSVKL